MIKLSKPYLPDEAYHEVIQVLKSGNLVQGKFVEKFETVLRDYLGVNHVIVVSSGTAALHISLLALNIGPGDEVIIPAFSFPATANVVEIVGAKPVFVDITLDDYCIDTTKIESAITSKTKAIIPVHEFGQAAKMDSILAIGRKHGLTIIEDAACALGSEFNGQKVGSFGDCGCFSFHPRKAITTGEGGAISTNNDEFASRLRAFRNHGIVTADGKIDFIYAGLNYRMTDFQAALGLHQANMMEALLKRRIEIAGDYVQLLSKTDGITLPVSFPERKHVYQSFHLLLDNRIDRDAVKQILLGEGIETNYGANCLPLIRFYQEKYGLDSHSYFPNSLAAYNHGLALPMSQHLQDSDVKKVCEALTRAIKL